MGCFFCLHLNMGSKITLAIVLIIVVLVIDVRMLMSVRHVTKKYSQRTKLLLTVLSWSITAMVVAIIAWYYMAPYLSIQVGISPSVATGIVTVYLFKFTTFAVLLIDDVQLGVRTSIQFLRFRRSGKIHGVPITRGTFLTKSALIAGGLPLSGSVFAIMHGAYDYRVRKQTVMLKNLPQKFDGIRLAQISDIHSTDSYNKTAVRGGVELAMNEKADIVLFTGDLVNYRTEEVKNFVSVFDKIRAPLGVFSVTGNHDYGDYVSWTSNAAKDQNFADMITAHKELGYDLLMNEHRFIEVEGEKIALMGIENWGTGRFPKYGRMDLAYAGIEESPVKILLSHDPSHWDAQVRPLYPDIDLMLAGHTHGFQMGIEVGDFKWSPAQYNYKQWAGLYTEGNQHLYVNRGFGCIGYLGRIGMPPEITILELKRG